MAAKAASASDPLRTRPDTSPPAIPKGSFASSASVRRRMQAQRRVGTDAELAVRRAAHQLGLRYFVNRRPLPLLRRTADLVFPRARIAVFVDGCFWHGCPDHARGEIRNNSWYWPEKIASNQRRDLDTDERLVGEGWCVLRIWEHEDPSEAARRIDATVRSRRATT